MRAAQLAVVAAALALSSCGPRRHVGCIESWFNDGDAATRVVVLYPRDLGRLFDGIKADETIEVTMTVGSICGGGQRTPNRAP